MFIDSCKMEVSEEITADHGIVLPQLSAPHSSMYYVKAVASMIGSKNIYGVYDNNSQVKIYLKKLADVDRLVKHGIHVMGQHINVDYNITKGSKVILSNVDPVISNDDIKELLSHFGTLESDIVFERYSSEIEYSHIKSNTRYVYMTVNDPANFPCQLNLGSNGMQYKIDVAIDMQNLGTAVNNEVPENALLGERDFKLETSFEEKTTNVDVPRRKPTKTFTKIKKKPRYKTMKRGYSKSRIANRIVRNAKRSYRIPERNKVDEAIENGVSDVVHINSTSPNSSMEDLPELLLRPSQNDSPTSDFPLNENRFREFLFKVRYHRSPLEIVEEFLGNVEPQTLRRFISQMKYHYIQSKDTATKLKLNRLINVCTSGLNGLKMPNLTSNETPDSSVYHFTDETID